MEENINKIIANMSKDEQLNIMRKEVEHGCKIMFNLSYNWRLNIRTPMKRKTLLFICFSNS